MDTKFKTKTGFCYVLPDRIILTREGVLGKFANAYSGKGVTNSLIIQLILIGVIFYLGFIEYKRENYVSIGFYGMIALILSYGVVTSLNNSGTPVIDRNKIKEVKFKKGAPGATRARFEVFFENEEGKVKKRLILLPGTLSQGEEEADKALALFKSEGYLE